jgi:hypothetical protein
MTIPTVPFCLRCDPAFVRPARYTLATLGMIAGFKPSFVNDACGAVEYGVGIPDANDAAAMLPGSASAQRFLLSPSAYDGTKARSLHFRSSPLLSLFAVEIGQDDRTPPSDIVSDAFFFLSLHQEWSTGKRDQFDRFRSEDSLPAALGMHDRPVVAEYARVLRDFLEMHGLLRPVVDSTGYRPVVCLTHDIDYMSKLTPGLFYREAVKLLLLNQSGRPLNARIRRFLEYLSFVGADRDPYVVSIDRILDETAKRGFRSTFFLKPGGTDKRDSRMNLRSLTLRDRIDRMLSDGHEVGVHPSFHTYLSPASIAAETRALEDVLGQPVRSVRQHYLRFRYPDTWRHQAAAGLRVDSTLGFAEREGPRNGACHPFLPYDLEHGSVLPIWEMPLIVMDGTLNGYRDMGPAESSERLRALFENVVGVQGHFVVLFHNVCYDTHDFPGWDAVFETFLDECRSANAEVLPLREVVDRWQCRAGYGGPDEFIRLVEQGY